MKEIKIAITLPRAYMREIEEAMQEKDDWLQEDPIGVAKEVMVAAGLVRAAKNAALEELENLAVDVDALAILGMEGINEVVEEWENGLEVQEIEEFS